MDRQDLLAALGPLAPLYEDPAVMEIMVDAHDRLSIVRQTEAGSPIEDVTSPFVSPDELRSVIDRVLALGDVVLSREQTVGELRLPGGARFLGIVPPTAVHGPCCVIRRLPARQVTWDRLLEWGCVSREAYEFLRQAVRARANVLIAGGTASGKTTFAARLAELIPPEARLIVVEPVYELLLSHPRCLRLEAGGPAGVSFGELVVRASCMRPDWLLVGELYGPEAGQALQVLAHGHTGMATVHAAGVEDALAQLEALCLMANLGLGLVEIRRLIASAVHLITYQELLPAGQTRRITHIVELCGVENGRYVLRPLFRYDPAADALRPTGAWPSWES